MAIMQELTSKGGKGVLVNPSSGSLVVECKMMRDDEEALSFRFAGQEFGVPWQDIV